MAERKTPRRSTRPAEARGDVITLADLAPRHEVRGGNSQRVFGADAPAPPKPRGGKRMKSTDQVG